MSPQRQRTLPCVAWRGWAGAGEERQGACLLSWLAVGAGPRTCAAVWSQRQPLSIFPPLNPPTLHSAELDIAFEDIASRPQWVLEQLAARLGLTVRCGGGGGGTDGLARHACHLALQLPCCCTAGACFPQLAGCRRPSHMHPSTIPSLACQVDCAAVLRDLDSLPVPTHWMDPVTQLWPDHISPAFRQAREAAEAAAAAGAAAGEEVRRAVGL